MVMSLIMSIPFISPGLVIPIDGSMMKPCRERSREGISRVDAATVQRLPGIHLQPAKIRQVLPAKDRIGPINAA